MRILVVDDDNANRQTLAAVLSNMGHVVDTAVTGLQAVEKCARDTPELAIVDRSLPDIDGRDVLTHLSGVPAIVWTGAPMGGEEGFPGVLAVVIKPDVDGLLEVVRKVAEQAKA